MPTRYSNKLGNEMIEFTKKVASDLLDKKLGDGFNLIMTYLCCWALLCAHIVLFLVKGDGLRF